MKKRLSQNFGLKVISIVIAFLLWLLVVNISQPEVTATQTLNIEVENADKLTSADKTYTTDQKTVRVSYRIRSPYRGEVSSNDFRAYIDLADYSITGAVPVYVEVDDSVSGLISDLTLNPMVVHVDTEDIQRKRFDITTVTAGQTAEGYMAGEVSVSPDYLYVIGPVSEVGQISEVGIQIDLEEADSALSGTAPVRFYDANGNEISVDERITTSREEISYELPIYRIKSLSIVADASGTPAEGYALENVEASPGFVDVYGDEETLSAYSSIEIPATELSVNGATTTVSRSIDITPYLPEGLRLAQPGTEVTIAARIRRIPQTTEEPESGQDSQVTMESSSAQEEESLPEESLPMETEVEEEEQSREQSSETERQHETQAAAQHESTAAHTTEAAAETRTETVNEN